MDFAIHTCCSVALIYWYLGAHNFAQRFYVADRGVAPSIIYATIVKKAGFQLKFGHTK